MKHSIISILKLSDPSLLSARPVSPSYGLGWAGLGWAGLGWADRSNFQLIVAKLSTRTLLLYYFGHELLKMQRASIVIALKNI